MREERKKRGEARVKSQEVKGSRREEGSRKVDRREEER